MLLTVTLNAALDVTYVVDALLPHHTHRVREVRGRAGGKGVNVARVLHTLGHEVTATGLCGGATGAAVMAELAEAGVGQRWVEIAGETRRTVAIVADGDATMFTEPGPRVSPPEWDAFRAEFRDIAAEVVVLSGSLPPGVPLTAYAELVEAAHAAGALVIVDADGEALLAALPAGPDVIKPNAAELKAATGIADVAEAAMALRERGAGTVVASLGADGLLAVGASGRVRVAPPEPVSGNPTGAGDACVAAIAAGLAAGQEWPEIVAEAVALSAATVLHPQAGSFDAAAYERFRVTARG